MKAFLDTPAAVALFEGDLGVFGTASADLIARSALFVSPILRPELTFLHEIERLRITADDILAALARELGVAQSDDPVEAVFSRATSLHWTRDPFDRMLVATAMLHRAPFVTRDQVILDHFEAAIW